MEDVLTEAAPPSRFFEEDLNSFTPPSPPLPSPFLLFSPPQPTQPIKPTHLIIALSPLSVSLFHPHFSSTSLLASLILPELPFSPATLHPSPAITLHSLSPHTILVFVPSPIPADRAHPVAKLLVGDRIRPDSVLVLDSIRPGNYRGRLSADEAVAFKLETSAERKTSQGEKLLEGLDYYPSGSVVDGLGAALLARCQIFNVRASLCVSWPQFDASVVSLLKGLLQSGALRRLDLNLSSSPSNEAYKFGRVKDHGFQSELYI